MHIDYHVEYDRHYYSVPHHLVKQEVEVQASEGTVALYSNGQRIASHPRSYRQGAHSTCAEHMPGTHRAVHEWSAERFLRWANDVGPFTGEIVRRLLNRKRHQEQNFRSVLALLSNAKKYGRHRLNEACDRALQINSPTRSSVESILKSGLDQVALSGETRQEELALDHHENVRGQHYYH